MAETDEPVRAGRSLAGVDRWIERHEDHHVRDRKELRGDIESAELRLVERMSGLEKKQREDHAQSAVRIDEVAKLVDAIQSVLDQQRGAKNLLLAIGVGTLINAALMAITVLKGLS